MKASDKAALAIGAVGTWIYIGGVDSDVGARRPGSRNVPSGAYCKEDRRLRRRVP